MPLIAREWVDGHRLPPLLCLPGLVRTGEDFETVAHHIGHDRWVVTLDYAGRGESGRSRDIRRYAPEACLRDVMDICAALHVHDAIVIGTSFGGLLAMALATSRPGLLRAVVLNDVGPEIGSAGSTFVRDLVGRDPALPNLEACVIWLRACLPPLSLTTDAEWQRMAELTYAAALDGRFHPRWDIRIARLLDGNVPALWPLFGALVHLPVLLVHGALSNILLPATVDRMQAAHPSLTVARLPGVGHAPVLTEPPIAAALCEFLDRVG